MSTDERSAIIRRLPTVTPAGRVSVDRSLYLRPETLHFAVGDSDLTGGGAVTVILTTSGGDTETVALAESPAGDRFSDRSCGWHRPHG